jgi:hypothetical protein
MAKPFTFMRLLQTCSWGILFAGMALSAEVVNHHGTRVESESGYPACLSCHDGVVATNISPCMARVCMLKSDHSVNKPYPPPDRMREFASAAAAELAGAKFIDGKIDCISCHDLKNTGRFHLRIVDTNSRLCLACHLK